jgi:Protein of unknown function DUF262
MQNDLFGTVDLDDFESEEDSLQASSDMFEGVVIQDYDWTTETLLSQIAKENIGLDPKFQRRDAWTDSRKSRFIESLMLGVPIPQIVLAESKGKRGKFIVIDGKQRLLSLQKFASSTVTPPLKLQDLTIRTDLNKLTWADLKNGKGRIDDVSAFENITIRTTIIKGYKSEDVLYLIYHRLNSGSVPLSPQELRHVLRPGPFIDFAFTYAANDPLLIKLFGKNDQPDFRMRDVEMLIRYFGITNFLHTYNGDLKKFLDATVDSLNDNWSFNHLQLQDMAKQCSAAITATLNIFGENAFRKYSFYKFESRFNRAVFDIMVYYFSDPLTRRDAESNAGRIVEAFESACLDFQFKSSIESTTKSVEALRTRLTFWGKELIAICPNAAPKLEKVTGAFPDRDKHDF